MANINTDGLDIIDRVLAGWVGSAEQIGVLAQYARDVDWGGPLEDPEHAVAEHLGELLYGTEPPEGVAKLRSLLVESATRAASAF